MLKLYEDGFGSGFAYFGFKVAKFIAEVALKLTKTTINWFEIR